VASEDHPKGWRPKPKLSRLPIRPLLAFGLGVLVVCLLVTGIILKVRTRAGTIILEIDQPGAQVTIDGEPLTIASPTDKELIHVKPGEHELIVTKGGFETNTRNFVLRAGE